MEYLLLHFFKGVFLQVHENGANCLQIDQNGRPLLTNKGEGGGGGWVFQSVLKFSPLVCHCQFFSRLSQLQDISLNSRVDMQDIFFQPNLLSEM